MEITDLKSQIKSKSLQSFYIFAGEEWAVQRIYITQIAKVAELPLAYIDSILDIYASLKSTSLFDGAKCYVVREDKAITLNEKMQTQIDEGLLGQNILILLLNSVDKRTKFYGRYKSRIVSFDPLNAPILAKYVKREVPLSDKACERLMEVCEFDYGRCLLEIDKIKRIAKCLYEEDVDKAFYALLQDGTIYVPPKDAIFEFADAVLDRKTNLAFSLYEQCKEIGEAVLVMITVLYNNFKAVFQVQTCESTDIGASTGLTPWQIKNAKSHLGKYRTGRLLDAICLLQNIESGIKRGTVEESFAMEYILSEVLL